MHKDFQLTLKWSSWICRLRGTSTAVELYQKALQVLLQLFSVKINTYEIKFKCMKILGVFGEKPWHKCQEINMCVYVYVLIKSVTIIIISVCFFQWSYVKWLWYQLAPCFTNCVNSGMFPTLSRSQFPHL